MGVTPKNGIPYPELSEPADVPADMKEMADKLDTFGYVPAGAIFLWPGTVAPAGWLFLQGQTDVPAASNPVLAGLFGTTGGFVKMPDTRDLFIRGASAGRPPVVTTGGEEYHKLLATESGVPVHGHGNNFGVNANTVTVAGTPWFPIGDSTFQRITIKGGTTSTDWPNVVQSGNLVSYSQGSHAHTLSGGVSNNAAADAATSHNNVPPFMSLNYIVRAG